MNIQKLDIENHWLPFTSIKKFQEKPLVMKESSGLYFTTVDDRKIFDGVSGLWCCNCGQSRKEIADAISKQAYEMSYAPSFQVSHEIGFNFAKRLVEIAPSELNRVFFTNSGSESCDTALKIVLAYHLARGEATRQRFIGREKGYHGVGFGGISVGGMGANRKQFGNMLSVDHLPHTMGASHKCNTRSQAEGGEEYADKLLDLIELHDASTIASVIVEPVSGSAGVIVPPKNYLARLREICDQYGILLIFDEVITGFGRVGDTFAAKRFNVTPDIITTAKGLTNGSVPMGAVFVKQDIYDTILNSSSGGIEFFHGYTYGASPLACAAGNASLDIYHNEGLFTRAKKLEQYFEDKIHQFASHKLVKDVRNFSLIGGVQLHKKDGKLGVRGTQAFRSAFFDHGLLARYTADTVAFAPPLIVNESDLDIMFDKFAAVLDDLD